MNKSIEELENIAPSLLQIKISKKEENSIVATMPLDGLFVAIGHKPDTDLFKDLIEMDEKGYIYTSATKALRLIRQTVNGKDAGLENGLRKTLPKNQTSFVTENRLTYNFNYQSSTSVKGIFAAGDCVDHIYRQATTAAGMGVGAALDVQKYLEEP
jgi:thioredoxin reductase (NADPH)